MNTYQPKRMDDQHRATDTEWYSVKARAFDGSNVSFSCILELLHRVEALEAAAKPAKPNHPAKPDSSLKDRVVLALLDAEAIDDDDEDPNYKYTSAASRDGVGVIDLQARAAIRVVAAALLKWHDSDQVVHTAWEAAKWLQQEAER